MKPKFFFINKETCVRLKIFGEEIYKTLLHNHWQEVSEDEIKLADYVFINSCSFLKDKEDKCLSIINKAKQKINYETQLVVFGCLPSVNSEAIKKIESNVLMFGRQMEIIQNYFNLKPINDFSVNIIKKNLSFKEKIINFINLFLKSDAISFRLNEKNVYHLKISEGCLGKCTYCSEKFNTKFKSLPIKIILNRFKTGLKKGFKIFVFNSDDSSCFGKDNKESIVQLLKEMFKTKDNFKLSITEFNPQGLLQPNIIKHLSNKKIFSITIPIQSGSQKILDQMRRPYKIDEILPIVYKLKKYNPKIKINTHIIVGFPGESKLDFNKSIKILKFGLFNRVKIFRYSPRPNTIASLMPNQIPENEKFRRLKILKRVVLLQNILNMSLSDLLLNLI